MTLRSSWLRSSSLRSRMSCSIAGPPVCRPSRPRDKFLVDARLFAWIPRSNALWLAAGQLYKGDPGRQVSVSELVGLEFPPERALKGPEPTLRLRTSEGD